MHRPYKPEKIGLNREEMVAVMDSEWCLWSGFHLSAPTNNELFQHWVTVSTSFAAFAVFNLLTCCVYYTMSSAFDCTKMHERTFRMYVCPLKVSKRYEIFRYEMRTHMLPGNRWFERTMNRIVLKYHLISFSWTQYDVVSSHGLSVSSDPC